jgi:Membrane domain of glycerophosphoryl diester phosphodiesterase
MASLSISRAWDEARHVLTHDGRLLATVALALVALPSAINGLINPAGMSASSAPWVDFVVFLASIVALAGQLALIRLAVGPSVTVGGAIAHGFARLPIYFVSVLLLVAGLIVIAIPFAFVLASLGVSVGGKSPTLNGPAALVGLIFLVVAIVLGVRFILSSAVASVEDAGPVAILKRSWQLTSGVFWPLLGFLLIFLVAAIVLMIAVGSAFGVLTGLLIGPIQPMSTSALLIALVQALVSAAVSTLFAVMLARIYLQLAGRGEPQVRVPNSGT